MLALRMAFSAPVFGVMFWWSLRKHPTRVRDLLGAAGLGLLGTWISPLLNFYGLATVSANLERLLIYACPVLTLVFAVLIRKEKMSRKGMLALVVSYLGVAIAIVGKDGSRNSADPIGTTAILLGCITYSLFVVLSVDMQKKISVSLFTSTALFASSVACTIQLAWQLGPQTLLHPPEGVIPLGLTLALACTVAPGYLVAYSIGKLGAAKSSVIQMIGPLFTPIASALILHEIMGGLQMIGFAFVLLGALVLTVDKPME